jgi:hypothetical protein
MNKEIETIVIAKFLGYNLPYKNDSDRWEYLVPGAGLVSSSRIEDLYKFLGYNFQHDWNSIMKIVDKIESLGYNVEICGNSCVIKYNIDELEDIHGFYEDSKYLSKMQAVYIACLKFIKIANEF